MRIDLPQCSFKYCRYCFDGNCTAKEVHRKSCEFLERAPTVDAVAVAWISVEDRLPETDIWCLMYLSDNRTVIGFRYSKPYQEWCMMGNDFGDEEVTHWMPLPKPPGAKMGRGESE